MELNCISCHQLYDYYEKSATIVCEKNHVICRQCANSLRQYNQICPYCSQEAFQNKQNTYQMGSQQIQGNERYWKPNSGQGFQNNPQIVAQNQIYNQAYRPIINRNNEKVFLIFGLFFLFAFICIIGVVIALQAYQYVFFSFVSLLLSIIFLVKYVQERRNNETSVQLALANNYANQIPQDNPYNQFNGLNQSYQSYQSNQGIQINQGYQIYPGNQPVGNNYVRI